MIDYLYPYRRYRQLQMLITKTPVPEHTAVKKVGSGVKAGAVSAEVIVCVSPIKDVQPVR